MNKHEKAKAKFWEVVNSKCVMDVAKMRSAIDYMLDKLPTWAVDRATGWMKDWNP